MKSTAIIIIVLHFAFCTASAQVNPVTPAQGFSTFIENNATLISNETEGNMAIGGDLILTSGTTYQTNVNTSGSVYFGSDTRPTGVLVNGTVQFNGGNQVQINNDAWIKIGNCSGINVYDTDVSGVSANLRVAAGAYSSINRVQLNTIQPASTVCTPNLIDFDAAFTTIRNYSSGLASCPDNVLFSDQNGNPLSDPNNPQFTTKVLLASNTVNVLNTTSSAIDNIGNLTFQNLSTTSPIIFNIDGGGNDFTWTLPALGGTNPNCIFWNFINIPNLILIGGNTLDGTVYAPNSNLFKNNSGNIQGSVIVKSLLHQAGEIHDYPWGIPLNLCTLPPEICGNGIDDDSDGLIDCADTDCGAVTITNVTVGNCINHPYADVSTLEVTVAWTTTTINEKIAVSLNNKTTYIDVPNGATSPQTVSFVVPADGSSNNSITANFVGYTCQGTTTYTAANSCSNDQINCSILYICGDAKGADADAFDHGLMQYLDGVNGSATLDGALAKNVAGLGLYDPNNTSTPLSVNLSDYKIILVSATTWGNISATLKTELKNTTSNILLLSQDILVDLAMASNQNYTVQTHAYTDNTTQKILYNFNNSNPKWDEIIGWGNYHSNADAYLWKDASNQSGNIQGVFFHYQASDVLGGVPTHGGRTFLGYMMDGVYWDLSTNMGATPVPQSEWFDPIRHLTLDGKLYLDEAIKKATINCSVENCTNGVDDDDDGLIDCDDSDCQIAKPASINND